MSDRPTPDTILQEALELTDSQKRAAYLDEVCGKDAALRFEIESLLAAHEAADAFMDTLIDPVWQETASEKAGDRIGRYKLLQQIGEGGFGTVYLAEQTEPVKRRVALKVIKAGMDSKEFIARFEAERQALALMDHPNIAKVHDAGTTEGGRPYFVMELVKGVPLTKYCADKDLDTRERLELFIDVCAAVQHAHQKGIIHRDLKPSNILVSPHDGKPVVKVIDFGIAKAISMELTEKTIFTQLGRMIGTPQYMSPEQAELNALDVDTRSDIYSLGVVLYELLTGTTPLDGEQLRSAAYGEMQRMIREETPPKPSTRVSSVAGQVSTGHIPDSRSLRGDLDWIVMKALEKERERRYETANALAQDIGRHLRNEPVAAGPPSAVYRIRKFARRNRRGLLSGAVAAVALLAGLTVAGGVWLNATFKENQRMAQVEGHAASLIAQAERLMERNAVADYYDDSYFRQAESLAKQLDEMIGFAGASQEVRVRRDGIMDAVTSERRDRSLIAAIEQALMAKWGAGGAARSEGLPMDASTRFAEAFRQYGMNPAEAPVSETVTWLKSRRETVRTMLLGGLLEWQRQLKRPSLEADLIKEAVAIADPDPWRNRLWNAVEQKNRDVLEELSDSKQLTGQHVMTSLHLAGALYDVGSYGAWEKMHRRIQRENPEGFWPNFELGIALLVKSAGLASNAPKRVMDSGHQFDKGILEESKGFLRAALAVRPDAAAVWKGLGTALDNTGNTDEAEAHFRRAAELDGSWGHEGLGMFFIKHGRGEEAISAFRHWVLHDPESARAHTALGSTLSQIGKHKEGELVLRKAVHLDPEFGNAHYNLAGALIGQRKFDEAIKSYRRAIELEPDMATMRYNLAVTLNIQGKHEEAIDCFKKAVELDPDYAIAHNELGIALVEQGKLEEAIVYYKRAINLDPDFSLAHSNLGMALMQQGKLIEGITSIREFMRLLPASQALPEAMVQQMEELEKMDRQILGIAREKGTGDPAVAVRVSELWNALGYSSAEAGEVRRFWIDHRDQVIRELEKKREVTTITLKKGQGAPEAAEKIRDNLLKGLSADKAAEQSPLEATVGARSWFAREDLNEAFQDPVFATPVGGVSKLIDGGGFWAVAVVYGPKVGADHDFDEPVIKEIAEALFKEQRHKNWEKNYLESLKERIKEGAAGMPAEPNKQADVTLAELAATKREAALIMIQHETVTDKRTGRKFGKASSRGVFISEDGLALVSLIGVCLPQEPQVSTADKTQLKFGTVLGIFPAEGLALMKFDHRPKVWLELAEKEPEVGESIALIPMNAEPLFGKVPVVVGPVMAKRASRTSQLRVTQFKRILSLGAGLSREQGRSLMPGVFAIDQAGHLVAFVDIVYPAKEQTLIYLDSMPLLFSRIEKLAAGGKAIPFPLAEADQPMDPVLFDENFYQVFSDKGGVNPAAQMPLIRGLRQRYPDSGKLKNILLGAKIPDENGEPLITLKDYPLPDPGMSKAEQVDRLINRNTIPWSDGKFDAGIKELKRAVELSPPDFPTARLNLAYVQDAMGKLDEAEVLYWEAYRIMPEHMALIRSFERFLDKKGNFTEAKALKERLLKVSDIYRR